MVWSCNIYAMEACTKCLQMNGTAQEEEGEGFRNIVREELVRFCRFTSIRGVPRTIRPGSNFLRVVWIFAALGLISLAMWQTSSLISGYLTYPKVTVTGEKTVSLLGLNFTVTMCDLNPLSSEVGTQDGTTEEKLELLVNQLYKTVQNFTSCEDVNCSISTKKQFHLIRLKAATEQIFFQNMINVTRFGHQETPFILECNIMGLGSNEYVYRRCTQSNTKTNLLTTPEYLNCFSIDVFDYSEHMPGVGVNVVLFLDNPVANLSLDTVANVKNSRQSRGIKVEVHPTKDLPTLGKNAITAPPGSKIHVKFEMDERKRLGDNFGPCVDTEYLPGDTIHGEKLRYRVDVCYQACQQKLIALFCQCKQPWRLGHVLDGVAHMPFCANISDGREPFIQRMKCVVGREDSIYKECNEQCQPQCTTFGFRTSHSLSQWPTTGNIKDVYTFYLRNSVAKDIIAKNLERSLGESFVLKNDPFLQAGRRAAFEAEQGSDRPERHGRSRLRRAKNGRNTNVTLDLQKILGNFGAFQLLTDNLIMVEALLKGDTYFIIEDLVKTPAMELISQIGGILNLWSGLNVIILVEVFELIYRLIAHLFRDLRTPRAKPTKKGDRTANSQL